MKVQFKLAAVVATVLSSAAIAQPNGHAPIGVMGDHIHQAGETMISARYSRMEMSDMRNGTSDVSASDVLTDFMATPTHMTMDMWMLGGMYAPTNRLTLTAMVPYMEKEMRMLNRMGARPVMRSEGLGDVKLGAIWGLYHEANKNILLNMTVSLPTGSIDEANAGGMRLPYPMQLGSGTFDPSLGVTYTSGRGAWAWGGQLMGTARFGENDNGYRLGNQGHVTGWVSRNMNNWISTSARVLATSKGGIDGSDASLNPMMTPTARTDLQGGERVDISLGANVWIPRGKWKNHRLAIEVATPIYENLNGPQMSADHKVTLGWQAKF